MDGWSEHRKKILGMSDGEIIEHMRSPITHPEVREMMRDELMFRIIGSISVINQKLNKLHK
jgi:hypothetical protein